MDKLETAVTHDGAVTATFRDSKDFTATVTISREDLAKLVRTIEGGNVRSRCSTFMQPDTELVAAAGAFLVREMGYSSTLAMSEWERIWTAEAHGWKRRSDLAPEWTPAPQWAKDAKDEDAADAEEAHDQDMRIAQTGRR